MSAQLPLPAPWAFASSPLDPNKRLENLERDKTDALVQLYRTINWLVDRHRADTLLPRSKITEAVGRALGYCEDAIAEATDGIEKELEREIEAEIDRLDRRGLW
jgi:hypothetical protein